MDNIIDELRKDIDKKINDSLMEEMMKNTQVPLEFLEGATAESFKDNLQFMIDRITTLVLVNSSYKDPNFENDFISIEGIGFAKIVYCDNIEIGKAVIVNDNILKHQILEIARKNEKEKESNI